MKLNQSGTYSVSYDIMVSSLWAFLIFMMAMRWIEASDSCDRHLGLRGPEMIALINRTYPFCDQRKFSGELPICEIDSENTLDTCHSCFYWASSF